MPSKIGSQMIFTLLMFDWKYQNGSLDWSDKVEIFDFDFIAGKIQFFQGNNVCMNV